MLETLSTVGQWYSSAFNLLALTPPLSVKEAGYRIEGKLSLTENAVHLRSARWMSNISELESEQSGCRAQLRRANLSS